MNWNKDKSILLSRVCVAVFSLALLALDVSCYPLARWFFGMDWRRIAGAMVTVYVCSVFAWIVLADLWRLLRNLRGGQVFIAENVRLLRRVSWCCVGAALVCLASILWMWVWLLSRVFFAAAAGFMALIVRIVKNVFQQAVAMKDELDLTI